MRADNSMVGGEGRSAHALLWRSRDLPAVPKRKSVTELLFVQSETMLSERQGCKPSGATPSSLLEAQLGDYVLELSCGEQSGSHSVIFFWQSGSPLLLPAHRCALKRIGEVVELGRSAKESHTPGPL